MKTIDFFKVILLVQLFWSFGVTTTTQLIPDDALHYIEMYSSDNTANTLNTVGSDVEGALQDQVSLPVIDAATLVFYSGNIIIDLILNFVSAIPQMFILLVEGLFYIFPAIDSVVKSQIKLFLLVTISVLYIISLLSFLTNMRSGGAIT